MSAPNPLPMIRAYIARYVHLPSTEALDVLAAWIVHTWSFSESLPSPYTTPYIYIHSPDKGSGKTRTIEVLHSLARNPVQSASSSTSAIFRMVESMQPTIFLDEVDALWSGAKNEEMRGMLNSGYKQGGHVWRVDALMPTKFSTFAPKLFAGIDNGCMPDTILDRCIPITLKRSRGQVQDFFTWEVSDQIDTICEAIQSWLRDNHHVTRARPTRMEGISDRAWEISFPLVAIADACHRDEGERMRVALRNLLTRQERLSPQAQLLSDIRTMFDTTGKDRLFSAEIITALDTPGWNQKLLSNKLRPFDIESITIREQGTGKTGRGYHRYVFEDAWKTYL